jgi:hypothetical protein
MLLTKHNDFWIDEIFRSESIRPSFEFESLNSKNGDDDFDWQSFANDSNDVIEESLKSRNAIVDNDINDNNDSNDENDNCSLLSKALSKHLSFSDCDATTIDIMLNWLKSLSQLETVRQFSNDLVIDKDLL